MKNKEDNLGRGSYKLPDPWLDSLKPICGIIRPTSSFSRPSKKLIKQTTTYLQRASSPIYDNSRFLSNNQNSSVQLEASDYNQDISTTLGKDIFKKNFKRQNSAVGLSLSRNISTKKPSSLESLLIVKHAEYSNSFKR